MKKIPFGVAVHIRPALPEFFMVKRSWKERLFTRPWQPMVREKRIECPENAERNKEVYKIGNSLYVTPIIADQLKKCTSTLS